MDFETVGRKDLYRLSVKITNLHSLAGVKALKWTEFIAKGYSPRGGPCTSPLLTKVTGDLQWSIWHTLIPAWGIAAPSV